MTDETETTLSDEVVAVLETLRVEENGVCIDDDAFAKHKQRFESVAPERKKALCKDLLAAAIKIQREAEGQAGPAMEQLTELCAILLVDGEVARALIASVTGADVSNRPIGTERVAGAVSPLGARFGSGLKAD